MNNLRFTDDEWLAIKIGREPTFDESYNFTERVGIMMDSGASEHKAREWAYADLEYIFI